jgi:hypothetical protein
MIGERDLAESFGASIGRASRGLCRTREQERLSFRHGQRAHTALRLSRESELSYARCMRLVVWQGRSLVGVLFLRGEPCRSSVNWGQLSTLDSRR